MEELIGALGIALVAIAIGMLWNSRMNAHVRAQAHPHSDQGLDTSVSGDATQTARFRAMPGLAPTQPAVTVPAIVQAEAPTEVIFEEPTQEPISTVDQQGHEDVEVHLVLAFQLQVVGDYEGADVYAQMAASDERASTRQVERAQSLLRRESVV